MAAAINPWLTARESARAARAALLHTDDPLALPISDLLGRGLTAADLTLHPVPPDDALLSGAHAVLDPESYAVWVRADAPPELSAYYVAHELAHFHLHENGDVCRCSEPDFADMEGIDRVGYGPRQRRETEANTWAREYLLPASLAWELFAEGADARGIAARVGLGLGVVLAQLVEGLSLSAEASRTPGYPLGAPLSIVRSRTPPPPLPQAKEGESVVSDAYRAGRWELDPSQSAAAFASSGPLLVGAGPGTGKTRTLTARVLYLTRELGVRPENILALTFSRKAAEEMRERIGQQDAVVGRRAAISTFHAYGLDLLRRHGAAIGLPANPVLLDPPEAAALLERRVGELGFIALRYLHDPAYPLPEILRAIGRSKEDLIAPEEFARRASSSGDDKLAEVARVYPIYESMLREEGALDYADLICRALRLLTDNDAIRIAERRRWQHVLVDEYQDVNRAGALLVAALSGHESNSGLWAVGDLRQAIYRFRGASPANVTRFGRDFPNGRTTELEVNYRSQPALVRLFGRASGDGPKMWTASREETVDSPALLAVAEDDSAQADNIAARMRVFANSGIAYGEQVALVRTRGQARALRAALIERGVPVAPGTDENNLLSDPDVRDLLALLSRITDPRGPARHRWADVPAGLYAVRNQSTSDAYDLLTEALWGASALARNLRSPAAVAALLKLALTFRDRAPLLVRPGDDRTVGFLTHLRRMARLGASLTTADDTVPTDAVRVLTVHASKGLEFPVVFVPNLSAGKFPSRPAPSLLPTLPLDDGAPLESEVESDYAEEERLFFVALTRARDYLILSRAQKYGGRAAKASPLLAGIEDAEEWAREVWVRSGDLTPPPPLPDSASPSEERAFGRGGGGVRSATVSIPAPDLDLYLRCPRRYYYRRVLDLPEGAHTAYAAFKRVVNSALSAPDPESKLDAAWEESGLGPDHPHAALYRRAAEEIVGRGVRLAASGDSPTLSLSLENGVVTIRPEAVSTDGATYESRTYRKPPTEDVGGEVAADRRASLLQAAAEAAGQSATLHLRYLQTGAVRAVANKPKQRAKHLMEYERALRGIQLKVFTPTPADSEDCPLCTYFFICPG